MNSEIDNPSDNIYKSIKDVLTEARKNAYSDVNFAMVQAYLRN